MLIAYVFAFKWLDACCTRYFVRASDDGVLPGHFSTVYAVYAILDIVFIGMSFVIIPALPVDQNLKFALMAATAAAVTRAGLMIGIESHLAGGFYGRYTLIEGSNIWLGLLTGVAYAKLGFGGAAPIMGVATGCLLMLCVDLPKMLAMAKGGIPQLDRVKQYAKYGIPLAWAMALTLLLTSIDRFFLAYYYGDATVGPYAAGYNLSNRLIELVFLAVWLGGYPTSVRALEEQGPEAAKKVLKDFSELLVLLATPAAVGLMLVAAPLATVMTGDTFEREAAQIIPYAALAAYLSGWLVYYFNLSFALSQNTRLQTMVNAAAVVTNIALNAILTPRYGPSGALLSIITALAIGLVSSILIGGRDFRMPFPIKELGKSLLACTIMTAGIYLLPDMPLGWASLMLCAGVGITIYTLCAWVMNIAGVRVFIPKLIQNIQIARGA